MKILFCGDRNWADEGFVRMVMSALKVNLGDYTVIEGEASGADKISAAIARVDLNLPVEPYPAEWNLWGKAAGPIRNTKMLREGKPDGVVAFHYDLSKSKGTKNMVEQALGSGLPVWVSTEGNDKLGAFILQLKSTLPNLTGNTVK